MNTNILIAVDKIPQLLQQDYQFIDIRSSIQFKKEHLAKFRNIPADEFLFELDSLDKNVPIVLVCYTGATSLSLAKDLNKKGYQCYSISGGFYSITTPTNPQYF